jgi:hypothetical protein
MFPRTLLIVFCCSLLIHTLYSNHREYKEILGKIENLSEAECKKQLFEMIKESEERKKNKLDKIDKKLKEISEDTKKSLEEVKDINSELKDKILKEEASQRRSNYLIGTFMVGAGGLSFAKAFCSKGSIDMYGNAFVGTICTIGGIAIIIGKGLLYQSIIETVVLND